MTFQFDKVRGQTGGDGDVVVLKLQNTFPLQLQGHWRFPGGGGRSHAHFAPTTADGIGNISRPN
jgi:hypothetical protein